MTKKAWPRKVPTAWQAYISQPDQARDQQYRTWCRTYARDPDLQSTADDFVFGLSNSTVQDPELDLDLDAELSTESTPHGQT